MKLFGAALFLLLPLRAAYAAPPANTNLRDAVEQLQAQMLTLQTQVSALQTQDSTRQTQVSTLQTQVNALQPLPASFTAIAPYYVSLEENVNGKRTVRFSGVNVQVVNGLGSTTTANGTGNMIVGYDEPNLHNFPKCTIGTNPSTGVPVIDESTCVAAGGSWLTSFKTGSHYLVLGTQNNYSRWGGIIAGRLNTSNYDYASVSGGDQNTASGQYSSVSGGGSNAASGESSSVLGGGLQNTADDYQTIPALP